MGMRCRISRCVIDAIQRAAEDAGALEACGILYGEEGVISGVEVTENVAENPAVSFEIDPRALFAALKAERAGEQKIAGYWHSHPSGDANPSVTDAAMAAPDGKLWLITGREMRLWRAAEGGAVHGRFDPVEMVA